MATIPTVTAKTTPAGTAPASTAKNPNNIDRDAFMKLLVAQMRYQDPSKPMDTSQMMSQTAQYTNIELLEKLQAAQTQMVAFQSSALASSLVGKTVTATNDAGKTVTGIVTSALLSDKGDAYLAIGADRVLVSSVREVK
jgi:flagellar basal-body rod modification protein FlgD